MIVLKVYQQQFKATKSRDEHILPQEILGETSIKSLEEEINLKSIVMTLKDEVASIYKDKRKWTTSLLLTTIWTALLIMDILGTQSLQLDIVMYLFSGRIESGLLPWVGYMLSRMVYSYFVVSTVIPILLGEYKFEGWKRGIARFRSIDYGKESNVLMILLGISISLCIYNFLVGKSFLQNTMMAIIMGLMFFKSYISNDGIVKYILVGLLLSAKRSQNSSNILSDRFTVGLIWGSVLAVFFSGLNIAYTGYFIGTLVALGVIIYLGLEYKR